MHAIFHTSANVPNPMRRGTGTAARPGPLPKFSSIGSCFGTPKRQPARHNSMLEEEEEEEMLRLPVGYLVT